MYVTRPLSLLRRRPELLSEAPQEGPNSGYMVLFDEECETTTCFGLCEEHHIWALPFPQNKDLSVVYSSGETTDSDDVVFVPVLNEPLSSNRYYVIQLQGKHKGEASASSTENDMGTCCCWTFIQDVKPRPLDPLDVYQQVEIIPKKKQGFTAASIASDGNPPLFLRRKYWSLYMRTPRHYQLGQALGLNASLRAKLPELRRLDSLNNSSNSETLVVGKWYCPFVFVKELGGKLKEQMKNSMFYEMTLEQRWNKIFECENNGNVFDAKIKRVCVDVFVERENACVEGREALCDWGHVDDNGVIWFTSTSTSSSDGGGDVESHKESSRLLGLSVLIMERIRWEQERVGFVLDQNDKKVKVKRTEEFDGENIVMGWRKFGCYVLVESFVLKRMDGTVLLTHDFNHTNQIKCIWE